MPVPAHINGFVHPFSLERYPGLSVKADLGGGLRALRLIGYGVSAAARCKMQPEGDLSAVLINTVGMELL